MPIAQGFDRFSIYETTAGTTVQCDSLDADETLYESNVLEHPARDPHGNLYYGGNSHRFRARFRDADGTKLTQLKAWRDAGTKVRAVAAAASVGGRNLQWYEDSRISLLKPVTINSRLGGDARFVDVELVHEEANASIYSNVNLLAYLGGANFPSWSDANADDTPDGYTVNSLTAIDFTSHVFTGTAADINEYLYVPDLVWPLTGINLTVATFFAKMHANADNKVQITMQTFASASLGVITGTASPGDARTGATGAVVASTYKLQVYVPILSNVTASDTVQVSFPSLRVDGGSTWTGY